MKSAILYASHSPGKQTQGVPIGGNRWIWVRAEVVSKDTLRALDKARPRKGEIVLNSIELPE